MRAERAATPTLWAVSCRTVPDAVDAITPVFDEALSVTVFAPPRTGFADIQALYDHQPDHTGLTTQVAIVCAMQGVVAPSVTVAETPKLDWIKKVSDDFPPLPIARWTIHGAMHRQAVPDRRYALQIDATSAFGTGEHPTTRGCLLMLNQLLKIGSPRRILDMGCGSGILAMGALKSRAGQAVAVDLDPDSLRVAHDNAITNGLRGRMRIGWSHGYRAALVKRAAPYDLILANIFAGPLSHMAKDLKQHLRPGGTAILSGLLTSQANRVLVAHRMQGLYLSRHIRLGEWSVLALQRRGRAE